MEVQTLCDVFYRSVDTYNKADHLKVKRSGVWRPISSDEFRLAVEELSMGLRALGIDKGDNVAILSENRPEWAYADLATLTAAAVSVPVYATLTPAQVLYILNDSQCRVVFVSSFAQAHKVDSVRGKAPHLRHVIRMDAGTGDGAISLDEVRAKGRPALAADPAAARKRAAEVKPGDLATIIYTSGTTGEPKGVMLTHSNLVSNVIAAAACVDGIGPADVALSFLPLCHVFERMGGQFWMLHQGATIAYAEGVDKVPQDMLEIRPTLMLSVPRLYEKIYARIHEKAASGSALQRTIFRWAVGVGHEAFRHQVEKTRPGALLKLRYALADKLVLSKVRARTGGRLRFFVSGGAPLARDIAVFFGAMGLPILEGYGLTETSPVIAVNRPDDVRPGTVGRPVAGVEVKIAEDGEILTRGPHVMVGYYKKPEATAEAIDEDGWFHTGDIGMLDQGYLVITDRKKDLIVTSGGKKVAPQPIESRIKTHPLFGEVVMIGNTRNFPAALIVPNFDNLEKWAKQEGLSWSGHEDLVVRPEVVAHYDKVVKDLTGDLASFEKIKKIALLAKDFSLEAGELTPTLKVKRRVVEQRYQDLIDRMYSASPPS